jgi:hypothetical protein
VRQNVFLDCGLNVGCGGHTFVDRQRFDIFVDLIIVVLSLLSSVKATALFWNKSG